MQVTYRQKINAHSHEFDSFVDKLHSGTKFYI